MNDIKSGVPVLGLVTKALELVNPDKGTSYHKMTVQDYDLGYVSVRIYGNINDTMKSHLETEGAGILVNATDISPWVPEDRETNQPKRYTKEGTHRTGKVIINYSATANSFRLRFLPKLTTEGGTTNAQASTGATGGDTVRGGDDSQPAKAAAGEGDNPWGGYSN